MTNSLLTYRVTLNLCRSLFLLIDDFLILRELIFAIVKERFFQSCRVLIFAVFENELVKLHVKTYNFARWRELLGRIFFRAAFFPQIVEKNRNN